MALDQALQGNQIILNAAWLQAHNCDCAICEELRKSLRERRASWIATAARLETLLKEDLAATEELERWLRTLGATAREHIWSIPAVHPDIEEDHIGRSLPSMAAYFEFRELQVQAMASEWVEGGWWRFDDQTPDAPPQPWDGTPGHAGGVCVFLWTFDDGTHADQVENNAVDLERMLRECGVIESPQT
ncbi:MAG: hypothetical protein HOC74_02305 [Gemmatimonadetes bacterium]|nr:hypothetical protein [Gemmatimonadota bacterium]